LFYAYYLQIIFCGIIYRMERKIQFSVEEFYHVYSRGNNRSKIFFSDADRKRFIKLLFLCNNAKPILFRDVQNLALSEIKRGETLTDIGAYCLMPNHFHILLREKVENGISMFMEKLLTAYSMYFNKKQTRTGTLFEGRFQAKHADNDDYLKYLFSYVHLNPVKLLDPEWKNNGISDIEKVKKYLERYSYSSYAEYTGKNREEKLILNKDVFPEYFEDIKEFEQFIDDCLEYEEPVEGEKTIH